MSISACRLVTLPRRGRMPCLLQLPVGIHSSQPQAQLYYARPSECCERGRPELQDTFNLLLGDFTQANFKRMFPNNASQLYKDRVKAVVNAVDLISSPACKLTDIEKQAYLQERVDALPNVAKEDAVGLRIDLELEDPATGETRWVDATVVHTAAESYREHEFKAIMALNVSSPTAARHL